MRELYSNTTPKSSTPELIPKPQQDISCILAQRVLLLQTPHCQADAEHHYVQLPGTGAAGVAA